MWVSKWLVAYWCIYEMPSLLFLLLLLPSPPRSSQLRLQPAHQQHA